MYKKQSFTLRKCKFDIVRNTSYLLPRRNPFSVTAVANINNKGNQRGNTERN
jgi:hypothetical protein